MKLKDVTPPAFSCVDGHCPSIYETDKGTYLIIGTGLDPVENMLGDKVAPHEAVVEIPMGLVHGIPNGKETKT